MSVGELLIAGTQVRNNMKTRRRHNRDTQKSIWVIRTRSIQDCLAWGFEYIHQCQQSKRETIILKPDFEKAFDTVEHEAILLFLDQQYF